MIGSLDTENGFRLKKLTQITKDTSALYIPVNTGLVIYNQGSRLTVAN